MAASATSLVTLAWSHSAKQLLTGCSKETHLVGFRCCLVGFPALIYHFCMQGVLREMLTTAKSNKEKLSKEYNQLNEKVTKLQNDLEEQIHQNAGLLADNGHKQISIKSKDEEISAAKAETARVSKIQGQTAKKLKSLEESRESAEHQRDTLKTGTHPTTWLLCRDQASDAVCYAC